MSKRETKLLKIELFPDVVFLPEHRLMVFRPRGIMNADLIDDTIQTLERAEDRISRPFHRFTDLSRLDAVDIDFHDLFRISLHRRLVYAPNPPVKSVFFVTSEATARVVRMHALLTKHSPLRVRMFHEMEAAAKWLFLPIEILQQDADSAGTDQSRSEVA